MPSAHELGLFARVCAYEMLALFEEANTRACATLLLMQYAVSGPPWRAEPIQRLLVLGFVCTCSRIAYLARRVWWY